MTGSMIEKKTDEFKTSRVAVVVAITVVAFILSSFLPVLSFVHQFYHL